MNNISFFEVSKSYIDYLVQYEPHIFYASKKHSCYSRKYIGVVFNIGVYEYFAPLSSYKAKHKNMKEQLDFLKIHNYAVINLNNMFPVPKCCYTYVEFSKVKDKKYKDLLMAEYRYVKSIQDKIRNNATMLYKMKKNNEVNKLTKRCNDFSRLEKVCSMYSIEINKN